LGLSWDQAFKVLELCKKPVLITKIMDALDWKHRTKFRNKFMHPLLETELIEMTIPDKPQSPNQQYVITEKGKGLLKELESK
jgi:ATP-dependent DNA helicase RecG